MPSTRQSLAADLAELGVAAGQTLLVHASLSSLGWVCGGSVAVVQALLDVLGEAGTLVVPTHTANNRDPAQWSDGAVPAAWWPTVRQHLPGFDPAITPSHQMGAIAERVRTWPGALRSAHPQTSFAALGPAADRIVAGHDVRCHLGEASPLARLIEADAQVLLLGVGWERCTCFHLAEYRKPDPPSRTYGCATVVSGERRWVEYDDVDLVDGDFAVLGAAFESGRGSQPEGAEVRSSVVLARVGQATCRLFPIRPAVEFAGKWLPANRQVRSPVPPTRGGGVPTSWLCRLRMRKSISGRVRPGSS
jgi:aminoglycoside 3-N-acetyltransferase